MQAQGQGKRQQQKRKTSSGNIVLLSVVLLMCVLIGVNVANRTEGTWSDCSVNNTSAKGYSVLFETFQRLGMKVECSVMPIEQAEQDSCQIVLKNGRFHMDDHKQWIENGGIIVCIEADMSELTESSLLDSDAIEVETIGDGLYITVECGEKLANKYLVDNKDLAYELYKSLENYAGDKKVIFNERYLYDVKQPSWWDVTPLFIKMMLIELGICLLLYFWYRGKRFGKAVDLVEEVERQENEYLLSVARLYQRAGAWELAVKSYYSELNRKLTKLTKRHEDFLKVWEEENLPEKPLAHKVDAYIKGFEEDVKAEPKRAKEMIATMEYLIQVIEKRREEYWKL